MTIGNLATLKAFEMTSKSGEKMSLARSLSDFVDTQTLLVHHEVLLPGRRASSAHFHSKKFTAKKKEIFLVLSGTPSAWIDGELFELKAGDFVGFNNAEKKAHMIVNHSAEEAIILTIGTNPQTDETTFVDAQTY